MGDVQQIERHFTMNELAELYEFKDEPLSARPIPAVPEDRMLAELVDKHKEIVWSFTNHDSLLENQVDQNLTEEERKAAWEEFENEKKQLSDLESGSGMDLMGIDSDDESALKAKKTEKKKRGKVDHKKVSKKKSGEKSGDSFSGGSDMDSDEKAYRK